MKNRLLNQSPRSQRYGRDHFDKLSTSIGLGYVGLPLTVAFAESGFPVVGIDMDSSKVAARHEGRSTGTTNGATTNCTNCTSYATTNCTNYSK